MPINCTRIQQIIQNKENGIPKKTGSTLLPKLYKGNTSKSKINKLNKKKAKSILFLFFISV